MKIRLLKISKQILSDLHFNSEEALKNYLEKHKVRPTTKVFVNGVPRDVATYKKKVDEKPQRLSPEDMNGSLTAIYEHITSNNIDIDNIPPYYKKGYAETLNHVAKAKGINDSFDEKRFEELFNKFLDETGKRKKKEEPKKDNSKDRNSELEKIYKSSYTNAFKIGNMSRKDYFNYANGLLKDSGQEELTEDEFKDYLREKVFDFKPSQNRSDQTSYAKKHFAKNVNWGNFSIDDVNTINQTLTELVLDYPEMEETLDKISTNARFKSNIWAVYKEKPIGWFNDGIINSIELNPKSQVFFESYIPFRHSDIKQKFAKSRGRDYRSNVGDDGENRQEAIARTVTHEVGHKLFAKRKRDDIGIVTVK